MDADSDMYVCDVNWLGHGLGHDGDRFARSEIDRLHESDYKMYTKCDKLVVSQKCVS